MHTQPATFRSFGIKSLAIAILALAIPAAAQTTGAAAPPIANSAGQAVAIVSDADLGFGAPQAGRHAIYVKDSTGNLTPVTECACPSQPSLSLSGARVVFRVAGPDGTSAAYYKDAPFTGQLVRIDVDDAGAAVAGGALSSNPVLSGNGQLVVFTSTADLDGAIGEIPGTADLFVRDLSAGRTERFTVGAQLAGNPSISADGRYIAFATPSQLLTDDVNNLGDVYLIDRARPESALRLLTEPALNAATRDATISAGGSAVAFTSAADGLVADDSNGLADVFVVDLRAGTTTRASVPENVTGQDAAATFLSISGNGRRIAFAAAGNVFVRDLTSGEAWPVSSSSDEKFRLAPDGRTVVASSPFSSIDVVRVQLPPDLPIGAGVRGDPFDPVVGQNPVTLVFSTVTTAGNIDLSIRSGGPVLPEGLATATSYFALSSEATTTGGALVCVNDMGRDTTALRLMHFAGGAWTDITTLAQAAGPAICGQAASLGTFVVATPVSEAEPSTPSKEKKQVGVASVREWNVDADGFWDVAANWSGGVVPGDGDTVIIDRPAGNFVITVRNPTANVQSVFSTERVDVTSVLTIAGTGTFNGGLILTGTLTGTGTVSLGANAVWQANTDTVISVAGGVDVETGRTLTLSAAPNQGHYLDASSLRNHGTVVWTGGLLQLRNGSPVTNDAGHLWDAQGDHTIGSDGSGTPTFTNAGLLRKSGGNGTLALGGTVTYTNSGTIDLQSGVIAIGGGAQLTNSGLLQLATGTTFLLDRVTLLGTSTFAGTGTLHANGNTTITGAVTVTVPLLVTVHINGSGTLHLAAPATWQANTDSIISVAGGLDVETGRTLTLSAAPNQGHYLDASSLRNHGTVVWTGGLLQLRNGSPVTNDAGHLWDAQGDHTIGSDGSGTPTFTNAGLLRKSGGNGTLALGGAVTYTNSGTIDLQSGVIAIGGGAQLTNSGLLQLATGTTFLLDRVTLLGTSTFAGTGTLHANGNTTITGAVTVTVPLLVTVHINGSGTLHLAAPATWQANTDSIISVAGGLDVETGRTLTLSAAPNQGHYLDASSLRNHGTVVWTGGLLQLRNGSPVTNDAGHLWDAQGDHTIGSDGSGTPTFTNAGLLRKSGGNGTLALGGTVTYTNSGTIDLQSGVIAIGGGAQLTNSGLLQLATGTTFLLDRVTLLGTSTFAGTGTGTLHANGNTTITGAVTVTVPLLVTVHINGSGTLHLAAPATWQANTDTVISVAGGLDVETGRTLTLSAAPNQGHYLDASSLRNHGTVVWTGGLLQLRNGSPVTNDAGHLWDAQGDHTIGSDGSGTPTFTNAGLLRKSGGNGTLALGGTVTYTNSGTIDLQSGVIAIGGGAQLTNSGLLQLATGTTFLLDRVTLLGTSTFAGTGTGTLHANGNTTITGAVTVTVPLLVTVHINGSGTLHLAAPATWQANTDTVISVAGGVDVETGRTLTLSAAPNQGHYLDASSLRNHGTVVWTGGLLQLRNGSPVTNDAGGVWDVQGSFTVGSDGIPTASFVNNGILRRSGSPNRLTMNVPVTNTGTFDVRIGGAGGGQLDEFGGNAVNLGGTLSVHLINGLTPGPSDQFKIMDYSSISSTFATLTGDGITFDACYTAIALSVCNIATAKITPTITWGDPADIFYGTALGATQLNATASVPGTFVYSPPALTTLNAGNNQLLQANFTPTDTVHFNNATASVHINVLKATPIITWANPAAIGYGTALSATQLNATASTAGNFVYTPAAGVKLHAGNNQVLSTTFTPIDTANFQTANASVMINVSRAPLSVTAANASKAFGAPLPSFTANFSGFVNSDTPANLTGTLVLSTTATALSPAGSYSIVPSGVSSPDYIVTFVPGTLTITRANTTTTLQVLPGTTGYLQPSALIAIVARAAPGPGSPGGFVRFMDGATVIGSAGISGGQAFILANGLASGTHSLTAVYMGSANFASSSSPSGTATVRPLANSTFTSLTAPRQAVGLPATLTARVTPLAGGTPTGTVQFSRGSTILGSASVVSGVATLNTTALGVGTHLLKAKYIGNATFAQSTSPPAVITIYSGARPAGTAVTVAASPSPSILGQPVTFTATVIGGATTGSVNLYADGFLIGQAAIANVGGSFRAVLTLAAPLSLGRHVLSASYLGSAGFGASNSPPVTLTIQSSPSLSDEEMSSLDQVSSLIDVQ